MLGLGLSDTILSVLAIVLAAALLFVGVRYWSVSEALEEVRSDAVALRADTARQGQSIRSLRGSIGVQNDSLAALRRKAQALAERVDAARSRAQAVRKEAERRARLVFRERRPLGCDAAIEWAGRKADSLSSTW